MFDEHGLSEVYEAMIDWPRRLANEGPFFRRVFERIGARRVTDVACGTGHHAALFHSWGLDVEAADLSAAMISRARSAFGESDQLRWMVRGFDQPVAHPGRFDAAICIGNSLALVEPSTAEAALANMLRAVRPGGAVIVQVLNLWKLPDGPCLWQKHLRAALSGGESLVIKGVHRCSDRGYVEVIVVDAAGSLRSHAAPFRGLRAEELLAAAARHGADHAACYGDYHDQPYDLNTSTDLILLARRAD